MNLGASGKKDIAGYCFPGEYRIESTGGQNHSDNIIEETAESILRQYQDQDFSYTDAVSFVVMKQYGITEAFSFDKHFVTAGFTLIP